jgi:hypothetical protein
MCYYAKNRFTTKCRNAASYSVVLSALNSRVVSSVLPSAYGTSIPFGVLAFRNVSGLRGHHRVNSRLVR